MRLEEAPLRQCRLGQVCAILVALIGGLALLEYLLDVNLGIDLWLFSQAVLAVGEPRPGRPAPATAMGLLLLGLALLALDGKPVWLVPLLTLSTFFIALLALLGNTYSVAALYEYGPYVPVALHTAVVLLFLALGILAARPNRPALNVVIADLTGSFIARCLLPVAILLPFTLGWLLLLAQQLGLYKAEFGMALFASSTAVLFAGMVYYAAGRLNLADAQRAAADADIRQSEARFRLLFDATPNGLMIVDADGRIVLANAQAEQLFGYRPGHILGQPIDALVPERYRSRHRESRQAFTADPRARAMGAGRDLYALRQDGAEFPVEIGLSPIETPEGCLTLASIIDISEREQAAQEIRSLNASLEQRIAERTAELRATAAKLAALFEVLPVGVSIANAQRQIVESNPALKRILKLSHQGLMAGAAANRTYIHPDGMPMRPDDFASARALREQQPIYDVETGVITEAGETLWTSVSAAPLPVDDLAAVIVTTDITEQKQAKEQLLVAQARLHRLVEANIIGIAVAGADGEIFEANDYYLDILDYTRQEFETGQVRWIDLTPPEHLPADYRALAELQQIGVCTPYEKEYFRKDGSRVWVMITDAVLHNEGGKIIALVQNITDRKRAEMAISESEARYRSLFENMFEGFAYCQILVEDEKPNDFIYIEVNPAFEELTGLTHVAGKKVSEVIPGIQESNPELFELYGRVALTGQSERFETYVEPLGIWFSIRVYSPMPGYFVAMFDNITARKQADAALQESEDKFKYVFDHSNIGKSITSLSGEIQLNQAFCEMLGYSQDETHKQVWQHITHPDDIEASQTFIAALLSGERDSGRFIKRYLHKNGSIVWADVSTSLRRDKAGQPLYFMTSVIDITERKQLEDLLVKQAERLRRSNTELEQFAYVASHDLQEPLRMVTSYVRLLQQRYQGQLDTKADLFIGYAVDGAARMKMLIEDLLAYSRVDRAPAPRAPTDCGRLLEQVRANLSSAITDTGATIVADPLPTLVADARQIGQLLQNLIGNAIKFHGADPPQIRISATRQDADWLFAVRDNGIGIDPQYAERVFEIFQRLHTRQEYPGTGIGLAICKKIVDHHGGRIWVESVPGEGTTFSFTIPIIEGVQASALASRAAN
jgi:PAS domain S-box-containing protein